MSVFGVIFLNLMIGMIALIIRLFFFVDLENVAKSQKDLIGRNSLSLIGIAILSLTIGILLLFIFYPKYSNPTKMLYSDFIKTKLYYGIFFILISVSYFIFKEKIIINWRRNGIIIPISKGKYKIFAISIGIFLFIIGLIFIII